MINRRMIKYPVFFGCYPQQEVTENDGCEGKKNCTRKVKGGTGADTGPIVLYLPNSPWSGYSNFSYTKSSFTERQMNATLKNAVDLAALGDVTYALVEKTWGQCLACAVIKKSLDRVGMAIPERCQWCFHDHCWDGVEDDRTPAPDAFNWTLERNPPCSFEQFNERIWRQGARRCWF
jgi:hypothetical protein